MNRATPSLLLAILLALVPAAHAQVSLDPPAPRETLAAFNTVESWIRAWRVPVDPQSIDPEGTTAACVTLRLGGRVLGRSTHAIDGGTSLWSAAREAWIEADANMPVPRDARRDQAVLDAAQRLTIDVQLAGPLLPILGDRFIDAALPLSPGLDGVAARSAAGTSAVFPGTTLSLGFTPELSLRAAVSELGLPQATLGALRTEHDLAVFRFRARQLAQPVAGAPPGFLHRGGRVVSRAEINGPALREMALALANHLQTHDWPGPEPHGMTGDYIATSGTYDPPIAPPRAQAIAAYALLRFAQTETFDMGVRTKAKVFAREVIEKLAIVGENETDPLADPVSAASWLLADSRMLDASDRYEQSVAAFRASALDSVSTGLQQSNATPGPSESARRALMAAALASHAATRPDESLAALARETVVSLYQETPSGRLVALMPWLSIASQIVRTEGEALLGSVAIRQMRDDVWQHQLRESDLGTDERDLAGGIVFTRALNPLPTWQTLRPLVTIAGTLSDPSVTSYDEFMPAFSTLAASLRFVMQLSVREAETHMHRDADRSLGGVRTALWDQRVSLDATSLALLAVCETLDAVANRVAARDDGNGP